MISYEAQYHARLLEEQELLDDERRSRKAPDLSAFIAEAKQFAAKVPTGGHRP